MFMIEGKWTGYGNGRGEQKVVHRHYVNSQADAEHIAAVRQIRFTDGTYLHVSVCEVIGKAEPEKLQYRGLIEDCVRYGVNSVQSLVLAKNTQPHISE